MASKEENRHGLYYVIPAEIMDSDELSPSEKLCYAFLSGLSDNLGECFPSNEYLARRLHLKENTVKIMLSSMESKGLIERKTGKNPNQPFLTVRTIKVKTYFNKSSQPSGGEKNQPSIGEKNVHIESELEPLVSEAITISSANASANAPASDKNFQMIGKYKNVKLTQAQIDSLKEELKEDFDRSIDKMSTHLKKSDKRYSSHYKGIKKWVIPFWLHNEKQDVINNQKLIEKNKKVLEEIITHLERHSTRGDLRRTPTGANDVVLNKTCEFTCPYFSKEVSGWYKLKWREEDVSK